MSKNVKLTLDGETKNYTGVSTVQIPTTDGGTAEFKDVDEIVTPSGDKNITANGTYDVSAFAQAVVNVPTEGDSPVLQEKSVTITENGTTQILPDTGNDGMTAVNVTVDVPATGGGDEKTDYFEFLGGMSSSSKKDVKLKHHGKTLTSAARSNGYDLFWCDVEITVDDELQEIGASGLSNMASGSNAGQFTFTLLSNNNFDNLTALNTNALMSTGIKTVDFPEVTTLLGAAGGQFNKCASLTSLKLPKVTSWTVCMAPRGTKALTEVQIGSLGYGVTAVPANGDFGEATSLTETIYTTGEYVDTIVSAMRSGPYGNATATIVIKASESTTYNGQTYSAGDTIKTDTGA